MPFQPLMAASIGARVLSAKAAWAASTCSNSGAPCAPASGFARRRARLAAACPSSASACASDWSRASSSPPSMAVLASVSAARAWNSRLVMSARSLARSMLPRPSASISARLSRSTAMPAAAARANSATNNARMADTAVVTLMFFRISVRVSPRRPRRPRLDYGHPVWQFLDTTRRPADKFPSKARFCEEEPRINELMNWQGRRLAAHSTLYRTLIHQIQPHAQRLPRLQDIREAVRDLCAQFPSEYFRKVDEEQGCI